MDWALTNNLINHHEHKFLLLTHPTLAIFYSLSKIHKEVTPFRGRPIVLGVSGLTQNAGIYLDKVLRKFVLSLPSYTRHTADLLAKLDGISISIDIMLASIDVEALYSSIPHTVGLETVRYYLNMRGTQFGLHNEFVLRLLAYVLEHNFFLFSGRYYHQLWGTAIGSVCLPTYANLLLDWWEATMVFSEEQEDMNSHVLLWTRYIDDVFILWQGDSDTFASFLTTLNNNQIGLKFTFEINEVALPFLDVFMSKDINCILHTKIYHKKNSNKQFITMK